MLPQILQLVGFGIGVLFLVIYYVAGGHSPWPALFSAAFTVHMVGDWVSGFLKPPLLIASFNISEALVPKRFTQFVGVMLALAALFLFQFGHSHVGGGIGYFGVALALTGFVWDLIYP